MCRRLIGCLLSFRLVNVDNPLFKVDSRFDAAKYFVAGTKNTVEKAEFFRKKLIHPLICGIIFVEKIDYHDIVFLAVSMTPAYSLLNSLGIPRKIIVDYEGAELEVDSFSCCLSGDHDFSFSAKIIDESSSSVGSF